MAVEYEKDYFENGNEMGGYSGYQDYAAHSGRAAKLIKIAQPLSVLDVGCAYGYMVRQFLWRGVPAMGCDISQYCEEKAWEIIPGHFKLCPAWDLDFGDKEFDLIYCEGVLEHLPEDRIMQVFAEFERVADRCYLQVSFEGDENAKETEGHLCMHDESWWFARMPDYTWLHGGASGTEGDNRWFYKG